MFNVFFKNTYRINRIKVVWNKVSMEEILPTHQPKVLLGLMEFCKTIAIDRYEYKTYQSAEED